MTEHAAPRRPPHNLEAEQALLGAILVNNEAHDRVSGFLEPGHFFDPLHQQIYETATKLIASGKQATPITLKTFFESAEPIGNGLSVPAYLGQLAVNATTLINVRDYGRTIYDLSIRRQLILIGTDMVNAAYDSPVDFAPKEQIEEAEGRLHALAERGDQHAGVDAVAVLAQELAAIEHAYANPGAAVGVPTGLADLDALLGRGMQPSDLIILAGRPSMGKTGLALSIVRGVDVPLHVFSLEMSADQIIRRLLSAETGIPTDRLRRGALDEAASRRLFEAEQRLRQRMEARRLLIDPTAAIPIGQLAARARRVKRRMGTGLVIVDHLGLAKARSGQRTENRTVEVSEITAGLKALAKELNVPVLALSQLSREVEKREDKRPQLSDLRDSGSIEQDADVVMFVYREEYYLARSETRTAEDTLKRRLAAGRAEIIVAKSRNGPIGTIRLRFDDTTATFASESGDGRAHP